VPTAIKESIKLPKNVLRTGVIQAGIRIYDIGDLKGVNQ
jgi:hypothetical protein